MRWAPYCFCSVYNWIGRHSKAIKRATSLRQLAETRSRKEKTTSHLVKHKLQLLFLSPKQDNIATTYFDNRLRQWIWNRKRYVHTFHSILSFIFKITYSEMKECPSLEPHGWWFPCTNHRWTKRIILRINCEDRWYELQYKSTFICHYHLYLQILHFRRSRPL
jgi:hypothetical protein